MVYEPYEVWLIECECRTLEHVMFLTYDRDYKDYSVSYQLKQYNSFWKRLWLAFKYVFNFRGQSHWDETLVSEKERAKIKAWLEAGEKQNAA